MDNMATVREALGGRRATWESLLELGASAQSSAQLMRCSRRTALRSLKAAARAAEELALRNAEAEIVARHAIGASGERSNWPQSFVEMAERIEREGEESVTQSERRMLTSMLPRGIVVG